MATKKQFKEVDRAGRIDIRLKMGRADKLGLWGYVVVPNKALLEAKASENGFEGNDARRLVKLVSDNQSRLAK